MYKLFDYNNRHTDVKNVICGITSKTGIPNSMCLRYDVQLMALMVAEQKCNVGILQFWRVKLSKM